MTQSGDQGFKSRNETNRARGGKRKPKERKNEDWREFKRRKVDQYGNESERSAANPFSKEEIAAESRRPKRKVAVLIGYAGTGYKGMQLNGEEKTIERDLFQAFVEAGAISKANADDPRKSSLARCARTDKGVHAAGNVISLKLIVEESDVLEKINAALPPQIRVWGIQRTNNSYNCYQYCDSRWYQYLLPSYCLLPPHPKTWLGHKVPELNKEHGGETEAAAKLADVEGFWQAVEEKEIKPILAALDPEVKARVLEKALSGEEEEDEGEVGQSVEKKAEETTTEKGDEAGKIAEENSAEGEKTGQVVLETVQPKRRELTAVDYALRDIKAAYISAKKRYRITPERLQRLQSVLTEYEGTHNFHNYTVQKSFTDASANRHIKSFLVDPKPIVIGNTEWLSLKVHGQSFMMHQIRKMVGLAALMVRCGTDVARVAESYERTKMAIPKAPGLGLLLERPVFGNYNRRATESLGREEIDFDKFEETMEKFKQEQIYSRIFEVEEKDNTFHSFFNQIDQFKADHFLWLSAGGIAVAENKWKTTQDVNKQLGDEDEEDPEGGEG